MNDNSNPQEPTLPPSLDEDLHQYPIGGLETPLESFIGCVSTVGLTWTVNTHNLCRHAGQSLMSKIIEFVQGPTRKPAQYRYRLTGADVKRKCSAGNEFTKHGASRVFLAGDVVHLSRQVHGSDIRLAALRARVHPRFPTREMREDALLVAEPIYDQLTV
ncbi:hypothetical protein BGX30_002238, partial [Mortierella sp. GBA39]